MVSIAVLQLVWHHFVAAQVSSVLICHCWPPIVRLEFARLTAGQNVYARYVNLKRSANLKNFTIEYMRHERPVLGVFLDWQCEQATAIVNASSEVGFFSDNYRWFIYDGNAELSYFRHYFEHINLSVDAQLTYAMPQHTKEINERKKTEAEEMSFILYDVYNNGWYLGGKLNMTIDRELNCTKTACSLSKFLSSLHERTKYGHRERLSDIKLRVAMVVLTMPLNSSEQRILVHLSSVNNTEVDLIARMSFKSLIILQELLITQLEYHFTNSWGDTETVGGCVGAVVNRSVELCGTPFLISKQRLPHLHPMLEACSFRPICMFRTPRNAADMQANVILAPFNPSVWRFFGCLLLLAGVLLWCAFRVEQRLRLQHYLTFVPSLLSTCLLAFGTACVQGSPLLPRSCGGRMVFFALSLICYLTYNYYTSAVVSTLLGAPVKSKIRSLGQLADSNLPVGVEPVSYNKVYLNMSHLPEVRHFVKRKITPQSQRIWIPLEEGIKRVRDQPGFVYMFEATGGYALVERYYQPHEICDLNVFLFRSEKSLYTHLHRNSSYKELFHLKQLRTVETGVLDKHRRYWQREKLHCFANKILIDVGLEYTAPLFIMLLCAYIIALLVLLLEILVHKRQQMSPVGTPPTQTAN